MSNFTKRFISSIILIPLVLFCILKGQLSLLIFTIVCLFVAIYEWSKMVKKLLFKVFGNTFLIISFYFFYELSNEIWKILFVIVICVSTDTGGYIFGKIFKGPKLIKISPNKTYAGMLGGYFLSVISFIVFSNYFFELKNIFFEMLITTIILSTISQIGDIIISFFKRKSKIKNTGKIIPGHGGLLDRIDGMIFTFPAFYLINYFI